MQILPFTDRLMSLVVITSVFLHFSMLTVSTVDEPLESGSISVDTTDRVHPLHLIKSTMSALSTSRCNDHVCTSALWETINSCYQKARWKLSRHLKPFAHWKDRALCYSYVTGSQFAMAADLSLHKQTECEHAILLCFVLYH
jgi:hypothetical protein